MPNNLKPCLKDEELHDIAYMVKGFIIAEQADRQEIDCLELVRKVIRAWNRHAGEE